MTISDVEKDLLVWTWERITEWGTFVDASVVLRSLLILFAHASFRAHTSGYSIAYKILSYRLSNKRISL